MTRAECWCPVPNPKPVEVDPDCPKHGDGGGAYGRRTSDPLGRVARRG